MDKLVHGIADGGTIRLVSAITTKTVAEAVRKHKTSPTTSAAFGRTLTGALLLGSSLKDFDRLTVKIEAEGEIGGVVAEANASGKVRGYVKNKNAELPMKENGKLNVGGIVGKGTFYVIHEAGFDVGLYREPYISSAPLVSGEIAEDFAYYLANSEQIPSAVLLGVLLQNSDPFVKAAGGTLIQMMPGAKQHMITTIEEKIKHTPHLTSIIQDDTKPENLLKILLGEIKFEILEEKNVAFECNCSMRRAVSLIASLGKEEVRDILEKDKGVIMDCGFCGEKYELNEAQLREILKN